MMCSWRWRATSSAGRRDDVSISDAARPGMRCRWPKRVTRSLAPISLRRCCAPQRPNRTRRRHPTRSSRSGSHGPVAFPGSHVRFHRRAWHLESRVFRCRISCGHRRSRTDRCSGAGLFVFTFARATLPSDAVPDRGETFVFSSWNGEPQCFLTERELIDELDRVGFRRTSGAPLTVYNLPTPSEIRVGGPPVIYEGVFRRA